MVIHETSQNLPKNNPFLMGVWVLSLTYFAYIGGYLWLIGAGMAVFSLLLFVLHLSKRKWFTPKSISIESASNSLKYHQDSTVYFRIPINEISKVQIEKEPFNGNCLMLYTAKDSYQVPNSNNFDKLQLAQLMRQLEEKIDDRDSQSANE
ncbi:hypothetical protein BI375_16050 [Vibrio rotiferianus]|uniref:PH domain-containing protein n=1 Tax=Vibrio rotiferianus TaxID=190895 RepID=A0ABX3DCR7_9VIBR|nr:hypothetical protein [Vibrio rotiferianus]OHY94610.1 hypothetical protein BI375_16050 [Vibrio rotiferianus]